MTIKFMIMEDLLFTDDFMGIVDLIEGFKLPFVQLLN